MRLFSKQRDISLSWEKTALLSGAGKRQRFTDETPQEMKRSGVRASSVIEMQKLQFLLTIFLYTEKEKDSKKVSHLLGLIHWLAPLLQYSVLV